MNKLYILLFFVCLGFIGCDDSLDPVIDRQTMICGESSPDIDMGQQRIFSTDQPQWIIVNQYTTEFNNCTYLSLHDSDRIIFSATTGDWYYDVMGFQHFAWYVTSITKTE